MRVTFVKTAGARDRIYVQRDDGTEVSWAFPSYGAELPHDLVHLVVEGLFGIAGGIWDRVAAGADLGRVNAEANRRGGKDKYRALGDDLGPIYLSEALANAPWTRLEVAPGAEELLAALRDAAGAGLPAGLGVEAVADARARLLALRERWRALPSRGALVFAFPPRSPADLAGGDGSTGSTR